MINSREWLESRRRLLEAVRADVDKRLGAGPKSLATYAAALAEDERAPWRPATKRDVLAAAKRARVVVGADFHAYAQSQRAFVRLLRERHDRPVTLALECVDHRHDAVIARFLAGDISEDRFLRRVGWARTWGFPWTHYRPFFELARERGYRVVGLGHAGLKTLGARDRWAAARVARLADETPAALVVAIIGEWHAAAAHLPRCLRQHFAKSADVVTILQDLEPLYFRLAARGRAPREWSRAPGNRFCQMVSPPWMRWQSYLMFLEHAFDRDLGDPFDVDYSDHVASLVRVLASDLGVRAKTARLEVHRPDAGPRLRRTTLPKKSAAVLRFHLDHDLGFWLPERAWLYLPRPTINHAAALAGQFLHAQLCGRKRALWDLPRDRLALIWVEAVGFFFSKWINPRRKADTLESIREQLARRRDRGRAALLLALDQRLSEVIFLETGRRRRPRGGRRPPGAHVEAARIVGHMLGERLFEKVRTRVISLPRLMHYLKMSVDDKAFPDQYRRLIRDLEGEHDGLVLLPRARPDEGAG